jgi:hypothetical protein
MSFKSSGNFQQKCGAAANAFDRDLLPGSEISAPESNLWEVKRARSAGDNREKD